MDPIHPIVPTSPTIPPVTPAPLVGRLDRDQPRGQQGDEKRRRRPAPAPAPERPGDHPTGLDANARDDDGSTGLHINVTA